MTSTNLPSRIEQVPSPALCEVSLRARVGRVLQAISRERAVSDEEVYQHAADCARLMEQAYARFEQYRLPQDRDEAVLWMHRRDEALRCLSPAFKAARDAAIEQQIKEGTGRL